MFLINPRLKNQLHFSSMSKNNAKIKSSVNPQKEHNDINSETAPSVERISLRQTQNYFLPEQEAEHACELRALWKAVITQALMDAGSNSKKLEFKKAKAHAISWLNGDSDDFYQVCIMADMDPDYVKKQAAEAIKRGCKWKKESNPFLKKKKRGKFSSYAVEEAADAVAAAGEDIGLTSSQMNSSEASSFVGRSHVRC